jgi:hypothetical protein
MPKEREETMFPNMIVHFLYEEQRRNDEIRQIQLENEYHRALRNGSVANRRNLRSLRSRFRSIAARMSTIAGARSRETQESGFKTGSPDACPEPCFAA